MPTSITIALDIMSGDNGPSPALTGAFKSLDLIDDLKIILNEFASCLVNNNYSNHHQV